MSLATSYPSPPPAFAPKITRSLSGLQFRGFALILLFLGTFGAWSVMTTLTGAVAVSGQFVVASDLKKVQHMQGGIIGELLVREGDRVAAGDVVMRLDPTLLKASQQIVFKQLDEAVIRRARLEAERDDRAQIEIPERLAARQGDLEVKKLIASEARLLQVRREALEGRRSQLLKRIDQSGQEVTGLKAQLDAKRIEAKILKDELAKVGGLYEQRLVQFSRFTSVQRDTAVVDGQIGNLIAGIAQAEGKIAETELQIIQLGEDQRSEATGELRDTQGREGELTERLTAAEDQLKRVDILAPVAGIVHELAVHTVGGVLSPGETAMQIVPGGDDLQVEANVDPADVDQVSVGQIARVKLRAANQRTTPDLVGHVVRRSADTVQDTRTGLTFYPLRIEIASEELKKAGSLKIIAGMPAEVFIETSARTPLEFLLTPLEEQFDRTFRER